MMFIKQWQKRDSWGFKFNITIIYFIFILFLTLNFKYIFNPLELAIIFSTYSITKITLLLFT
jgi:hypothetical protein